jgi:CopG family nickel-responsive transcriptional regulator
MKRKTQLIRFGVSMPAALMQQFDGLINARGYGNRSEAIRDLIRKELIGVEVDTDARVIGVLHLLYDHHQRDLSETLTELQHRHHHLIISSIHVHLDHDHCLEVILCQGRVSDIRALSDMMIAVRGVVDGNVYFTTPL